MKGALILIGLLVLFAMSPYSICVSDGWSMTPKLPPYNVNLIQERDYEYPWPVSDFMDYNPPVISEGDTVLAYSPRTGHLITHDVIKIDSAGYLLKGYNDRTNPVPDGYVNLDNIIGRVVEIPVIGTPVFVNLSVFLTCFGSIGIIGFLLSAGHDKYEKEVKGKKKRMFEDLMLWTGFVLVISMILNWIIFWRMII